MYKSHFLYLAVPFLLIATFASHQERELDRRRLCEVYSVFKETKFRFDKISGSSNILWVSISVCIYASDPQFISPYEFLVSKLLPSLESFYGVGNLTETPDLIDLIEEYWYDFEFTTLFWYLYYFYDLRDANSPTNSPEKELEIFFYKRENLYSSYLHASKGIESFIKKRLRDLQIKKPN